MAYSSWQLGDLRGLADVVERSAMKQPCTLTAPGQVGDLTPTELGALQCAPTYSTTGRAEERSLLDMGPNPKPQEGAGILPCRGFGGVPQFSFFFPQEWGNKGVDAPAIR